MTEKRGLKALEYWCRKATTGYRDVKVSDMSHSWRDGLAFCALIHHYRPDLIDFNSLSKENVFQNNRLAFTVAEKQLGIPALLDAEDMVKYREPDRLSIATYVSQFYQYFEKDQSPRKLAVKRPNQCSTPPSTTSFLGPPTKIISFQSGKVDTCQECNNRVFLLERLMVDGKLYHRSCFRCVRCKSILNPGAYIETDHPGEYECTVCPNDEGPEFKFSPKLGNTQEKQTVVEEKSEPLAEKPPVPEKNLGLSDSVRAARKLFESNLISSTDDKAGTSKSVFTRVPSDSHKHKNSTSRKEPIDDEVANSSKLSLAITRTLDAQHKSKLKTSSSLENIESSVTCWPEKEDKPPIADKNVQDLKPSEVPSEVWDKTSSKPEISLDSLPDKPSEPRGDGFKRSQPERRLSSTIADRIKRFSLDSSTNHSSDFRKSCHILSSGSETSKSDKVSSEVVDIETTQNDEKKIKEVNSTMCEEQPNLKLSVVNLPVIKSTTLPRNTPLPKPAPRTNTLNSESKRTQEKISGVLSLKREFSNVGSTEEVAEKPPQVESSDTNITEEVLSEKPPPVPTSPPPHLEEPSQTSVVESPEKSEVLNSSRDSDTSSFKYPGDLNPFGDDDESSNEEDYPESLNPFESDSSSESGSGNEAGPRASTPQTKHDGYDDSLNPFGSSSDEDADNNNSSLQNSGIKSQPSSDFLSVPKPMPRSTLKKCDSALQVTSVKKKKAPAPPPPGSMSPLRSLQSTPNISQNSSPVSEHSRRFHPSPLPRKKVAPKPPDDSKDLVSSDREPNTEKQKKDLSNLNLMKSQSSEEKVEGDNPSADVQKNTFGYWKRKKRPAPSVPVAVKREIKKISLKEIQSEMKEIEEKQRELEDHGRELEIMIRDKNEGSEATVEEEELIMQLFELVNQKNELFRRQAELMYIKRSQRLEEEQVELEYQIRCIMTKPLNQKTDDDAKREEELLQKLLEVVELRNEIVESQEMDRRRVAQEDVSIQEHMAQKQSELKGKIADGEKPKKSKKDKKVKKEKKKKSDRKSQSKGDSMKDLADSELNKSVDDSEKRKSLKKMFKQKLVLTK